MANRLKLILPDIICEAQSAFVPGLLITDNALVAFECFHFMKKKISGRNGVLALKLDMSKAYDRVKWPFLASVVLKMGFPQNWVDLIMSCVTTVSFSIMLNGVPQNPFSPGRGLRYDSVIFARATVDEVECVKEILSTYERASGQVINLDKSTLTCSRNVPDDCFNHLKGLMHVKVVECFDKYLGLPTIIGMSKTQIFNFVKDRVWKKLFLELEGRFWSRRLLKLSRPMSCLVFSFRMGYALRLNP
ncbi:uncharacterized protein LOC130743447 [Lotus japonicus]|uniref:uncharacterized protein LOC130743447 n=1 Tax=Lotus japonicus TaxID=34305 RepID=UPI00258D6066|nr:uncharacterized protein LOC130743447 [Lotus japonicus]